MIRIVPLVCLLLATTRAAAAGQCIQRQELTARAAGIVQRYVAAEGQTVKKGDVIVEFDDRQIKAALREADAAVEAAKAHVALAEDAVSRIKKLKSGETVSQQNAVEARLKSAQAVALLRQAEAALERVRVQFDDTRIKAEIDGTVRGLPTVLGLGVQTGQSLGRIEAAPGSCPSSKIPAPPAGK